jgi:hypothetical protein
MAQALVIPPLVKSVGASGQISLGKEYAGRQVLVEMPAEGVWIIKTARIVPDNEAWLEKPQIKQRVARAIEWASQNAPQPSNPDNLVIGKPDVKRKARSA